MRLALTGYIKCNKADFLSLADKNERFSKTYKMEGRGVHNILKCSRIGGGCQNFKKGSDNTF